MRTDIYTDLESFRAVYRHFTTNLDSDIDIHFSLGAQILRRVHCFHQNNRNYVLNTYQSIISTVQICLFRAVTRTNMTIGFPEQRLYDFYSLTAMNAQESYQRRIIITRKTLARDTLWYVLDPSTLPQSQPGQHAQRTYLGSLHLPAHPVHLWQGNLPIRHLRRISKLVFLVKGTWGTAALGVFVNEGGWTHTIMCCYVNKDDKNCIV
jgi:hypothetical protein